jgi:hypothetical protein
MPGPFTRALVELCVWAQLPPGSAMLRPIADQVLGYDLAVRELTDESSDAEA